MGLVTRKELVCDRCGKSVPASDGAVAVGVAGEHPGWLRIGDNRFLCPDCAPGYELLVARHKVEIEGYVGGEPKS